LPNRNFLRPSQSSFKTVADGSLFPGSGYLKLKPRATHRSHIENNWFLNGQQKIFGARRQEVRLSHLPSPMFLWSVYVLIALALGKYGALDGSADSKGKLQLTVF
jgi:hypothetical protein